MNGSVRIRSKKTDEEITVDASYFSKSNKIRGPITARYEGQIVKSSHGKKKSMMSRALQKTNIDNGILNIDPLSFSEYYNTIFL